MSGKGKNNCKKLKFLHRQNVNSTIELMGYIAAFGFVTKV